MDVNTRQILRAKTIHYMVENDMTEKDFLSKDREYPLSVKMVRDLIHNNKKKAAWKPRSQYKLLKFFGLIDNFELVDDDYIIKNIEDDIHRDRSSF